MAVEEVGGWWETDAGWWRGGAVRRRPRPRAVGGAEGWSEAKGRRYRCWRGGEAHT
jgi:hypothetical protein